MDFLDTIEDLLNEIISTAETGYSNSNVALSSIAEIAENIKEEIRIAKYEEWKTAESEYENR